MRINILLVLFLGVVSAIQGQEILVKANGGISGVDYKSQFGEGSIKSGGGLGIGYTYYFSKTWGINTGLDFNVYRTDFKLNNTTTVSSYEIDDQTSAFEYRVAPNNYKEEQQFFALSIPLMVQYRALTSSKTGFYLGLGGKVIFPMKQKTNVSSDNIQLSGYYPDLNLEIDDLPNHGFGAVNNYNQEVESELKTTFALSAEAGLYFKLKSGLNLYTGIYVDYGLSDLHKVSANNLVTYSPSGIDNIKGNGIVSNDKIVDKNKLFSTGFQLKLGFSRKQKASVIKEVVSEEDAKEQEAVKPMIVKGEAPIVKEEEAEQEKEEEVVEDITQPNLSEQELNILAQPLLFDEVDNVAITSSVEEQLNRTADLIQKHSHVSVVIEGHTCNLGGKMLNKKIGQQRAQAVANYLKEKGIDTERIQVVSKGETQPLVPNDSEENRKRNRRVEIIVVK